MIHDILQNLPSSDKKRLNYAFEQEIVFYILLEDGKHFIGVNTDSLVQLLTLERAGLWRYGEIKYN